MLFEFKPKIEIGNKLFFILLIIAGIGLWAVGHTNVSMESLWQTTCCEEDLKQNIANPNQVCMDKYRNCDAVYMFERCVIKSVRHPPKMIDGKLSEWVDYPVCDYE